MSEPSASTKVRIQWWWDGGPCNTRRRQKTVGTVGAAANWIARLDTNGLHYRTHVNDGDGWKPVELPEADHVVVDPVAPQWEPWYRLRQTIGEIVDLTMQAGVKVELLVNEVGVDPDIPPLFHEALFGLVTVRYSTMLEDLDVLRTRVYAAWQDVMHDMPGGCGELTPYEIEQAFIEGRGMPTEPERGPVW
jgi:hypothetical protein